MRSVPEPASEPIDLAAERAAYLERAAENGALHQTLFDAIEEKRQGRDWVVIMAQSGVELRLEEGYVGYVEPGEVIIDGTPRLVKTTLEADRRKIGDQEVVEFLGRDYAAEWDSEHEARNVQGPPEPVAAEEIHILRGIIKKSTIVDFASGEQE